MNNLQRDPQVNADVALSSEELREYRQILYWRNARSILA